MLRKITTTPERISGALFDFGAWLTTRPKSVTLGASEDSGQMVTLLEEWAKERGFDLDEADVMGWQEGLGIQAMKEAVDDKSD